VEGALEHAVEAGFIAMQEAQRGLAGELGEGGGEAGELVAVRGGRLAGDRGIHDSGFQCPGAALAPEGGDHLLDHAQLNAVGRAEAVEILGQEGVKALAGFVFEDNALGQETVAQSV